jgi:hypothetical protein
MASTINTARIRRESGREILGSLDRSNYDQLAAVQRIPFAADEGIYEL